MISLSIKLRKIRDYWAGNHRESNGFMHDVCLAKSQKPSSNKFVKNVDLIQREEKLLADIRNGLQGES